MTPGRGGPSRRGDDLRQAADRRGDHRQARRHRLEHRERRTLGRLERTKTSDLCRAAGGTSATVACAAPTSSTRPRPAAAVRAMAARGASPGTVRRARRREAGSSARSREQRRKVLRGRKPADARRSRCAVPRRAARREGGHVDGVWNHRRVRLHGTCPGVEACRKLGLRDADDHRGQGANGAVGPHVDMRRCSGRRLERPAVRGEDAHRHASGRRGDAAEEPPAFELLRCTMSGRTRRKSRVSSSTPSGSSTRPRRGV